MELEAFVNDHSTFNLIEVNGISYLKIEASITENEMLKLLNHLREGKYEFAFHDTIHPTISDPGAYFSYSTEKTNELNSWSMTYGNHGWSGGIYHISTKTITKQLLNLIRKKELDRIKISNVAFFGHYKVESKEKSMKKDLEISLMHE